MEEKWIAICCLTLVNRIEVLACLLILMENFQISRLHDFYVTYSGLLMPAHLFGPTLIFGTLECIPRTIHKMVKPSRSSTFITKGGLFSEDIFKLVLSQRKIAT